MAMSIASGRHAGLLLPLFSMPSSASWGIGEIGDIPVFASWLRKAGQDLLQLLPINEMAVGQRSPYSALTAMAIDPIFISVHAVEEFAALGGEAAMDGSWRERLAAARQSPVIDHALVRSVKAPALRAAFEQFVRADATPATRRFDLFQGWRSEQSWWLDDYALFRALHASHGDRGWLDWAAPLRDRDPGALVMARKDLEHEIFYRMWLQWVADTQWHEAKAASGDVALMGDLAFMVDGDSADVWAHRESFCLDASVGAPPDAFSDTGQNWGMPAYHWDALAQNDYRWLRQRARRTASLFDGYRVDHLVGFYRTYSFPRDGSAASFSPPDEPSQLALGEAVMRIFAQAGSRIIAEDLGTVPDFVRASLAGLDIPGYKVFRWERFWNTAGRPYRAPADYPAASVATTGTHDTDPIASWWDELDPDERDAVLEAPGVAERADELASPGADFSPDLRDILLEVLFESASDFLLLPVQDVFGWRDRINIPGSQGDHNWTWRLPWPVDSLEDVPEAQERAATLKAWGARYGRGKSAGARTRASGSRT
jgi:4-alpha-glucanotransferase